mgnify:CR=1 FL=1
MSQEELKEAEQTSIVTVVLFDGSSESELKIAMARIDGSGVTLTTLADITKAGMTYIRAHGLKKMFASSGLLEIEEQKENGND